MAAIARVRQTPSPAAIAMALLMGCGLGSSALAASNPVVICDQTTQDRQSLIAPLQRLAIKAVDHFPAASSSHLDDPLNFRDDDLQVVAPVLSLTPRVTTLLDQIFATDSKQSPKTEATSPVAEQQASRTELQQDPEATTSLLQQMYRKDI